MEHMQNLSVKWKFSVPRAPWKNGFFERLIGVTKGGLAKALYRKVVSFEELRTLTSEFSAIINNRPLTYLSEDSMECLTPAHLIFGRSVCLSPPLNILASDEIPYAENLDLRNQYARLSSVLCKFEKLWNSDYLTALRERHYSSVNNCECPFKEGDIVLVDLGTSRKWWPLGRIQKLIPSTDGVVRSLLIKPTTIDIKEGETGQSRASKAPLLCVDSQKWQRQQLQRPAATELPLAPSAGPSTVLHTETGS
ncbi:uncharacterized protein [Macrobrachium rosenbergii]|uniref:uncharacterized protein n=1 Tax=Macrobrachium rosenbergii TaxID=79674 RepID=UPI0034D3B059